MLFRNPVDGYIHPVGYNGPVNVLNWKITQPFGCTGFSWEPALGTCPHFHRGIDIADGTSGSPIYAPQSGRVHWSGITTDHANVIEIDHGGGWGSASGHLKTRLVGTGALVVKGQKIGYHDCTGNCTGPHDHFVIKDGVNWASPLGMLSDHNGRWLDPNARLEQNVTARPNGSGINIRNAPGGAVYAHTLPNGHIERLSDKFDYGLTAEWRKWGGNVASTALGQAFWRKILLGSSYFYVGDTVSAQSIS